MPVPAVANLDRPLRLPPKLLAVARAVAGLALVADGGPAAGCGSRVEPSIAHCPAGDLLHLRSPLTPPRSARSTTVKLLSSPIRDGIESGFFLRRSATHCNHRALAPP